MNRAHPSLARSFVALCFSAALTLAGCEGCVGTPPGNDGGAGSDASAPRDDDAGELADAGADAGVDAGPSAPTDPIRDPNPNDPDNATLDSDCDGLSDLEEFTQTYAGGLKTSPADYDSDDDGIADGVEAGRSTAIDAECPATWSDADPSSVTNPTVVDSDADCIADGQEDANRNGAVDAGETNPTRADSDNDGISDGEEDANCNGAVDDGETDASAVDTDGDGLNDGVEGGVGTSPTNPDSDGDGIPDGIDPDPLAPTPDGDGDGIADDLESANGTSPSDPDSDDDGLCDGPNSVTGTCAAGEDLNGNGLLDPGESDPLEADTDCDGVSDEEERTLGTNARAADSDGDLISDGVELGKTTGVTGSACPAPAADGDPTTTTDPLAVDSDGDGLNDGIEDRDRDGALDAPPADPTLTAQETDPANPDSDDDGICDGPGDLAGAPCVAGEDRNRNGRVDGGETNPNEPDVDTDGDGINDSVEAVYCDGASNCLDPNDPDSDDDGIEDGDELFVHTTDPLSPDSDCDGVSDGEEAGSAATNPLAYDSDGDGISDGVELGKTTNIGGPACVDIFVADADPAPATNTDPNDNDSDGDGVLDGAEDGNQNGAVDAGELNPNDPADAAPGTPVSNACANPILPNLHQQQPADAVLATHPDFPLANAGVIRRDGQVVGLTTVDATNGILGFAVRTTPEGADALAQLASTTGRVAGLTVPIEQPFTTWDGFGAARGTYSCGTGCLDGGGSGIVSRGQRLVRRVLNRGATDAGVEVPFVNAAAFNGDVKVGIEVVRRSATTAVVVGAITSLADYDNPLTGRDFRLEDIFGGSALAQVGDTIGTECDRFTGQQNQKVDFIWVVDDSGSMGNQQAAVAAAADAMATQLENSTLDWRIAVVTTQYWTLTDGTAPGQTYCDFMSNGADFEQCIEELVAEGRGDERGWQSLQKVFADRWLNPGPTPAGTAPVASRLRADARVAVVVVADSGDQSREADGGGGYAASDIAGWQAWAAGGAGAVTWDPTRSNEEPLMLSGIICPLSAANASGCNGEGDSTTIGQTNYTLDVYYDVINSQSGVIGSISVPNGASSAPANELADTIEAIMNVVVGQVAPYELTDDPISATIKVAIGAKDPAVPGTCPNLADLPRSRENGFSYDAATNQIAFWGACRPELDTPIAVSYRTWIDLTGDPNGGDQPCGGECSPPFVCVNDQCVCPSDCGGNLGPGQTCNPATCEPECLDDCGGTCGNGQVCDTASCSCTCDCADDAAPPPGYPSTFVCDTATCQWSCPADGCDPSTRPAGENWVCGADCTWTCPDDCGDPDIGATERCNRQTCQVECAADCNAQCDGFTTCNRDSCACECVENASCAPGFAFDAEACTCVCDAAALGCPATHVPNLDSCTCECGDNCNGACGAGTLCNENVCECVPFGG